MQITWDLIRKLKRQCQKKPVRTNQFNKIAEHQINLTSLAIPYTTTEQKEKKTIPFTVASKTIPMNKFNQRGKISVSKVRPGPGYLLGYGKEFGFYPNCSEKSLKSISRGVLWLH